MMMDDYYQKKEFDNLKYPDKMKYPIPWEFNANWSTEETKCFYCGMSIHRTPKAIKDLDGKIISYLCSACAEKIEVLIKKKDETD